MQLMAKVTRKFILTAEVSGRFLETHALKISIIAKFGLQMLKNTENIASRNLRILYIFILRTEKVATFEAKLKRK